MFSVLIIPSSWHNANSYSIKGLCSVTEHIILSEDIDGKERERERKIRGMEGGREGGREREREGGERERAKCSIYTLFTNLDFNTELSLYNALVETTF